MLFRPRGKKAKYRPEPPAAFSLDRGNIYAVSVNKVRRAVEYALEN